MRRIATFVVVLGIGAWAGHSPSHASDISLNAVSYHDMPSNEAVAVETFDDAEETLNLKARFVEALRTKGYSVQSDGRLILSFQVLDKSGTWTGGGPNRLIELRNSENHTGTDAPNVRLNIFDSQRGGILNPKRDTGITEVAPSEYRIEVTLEDRTDGKRLWEGWAVSAVGGSDDPTVRQAMVTPLIDNMGATVKEQKIPLR